ncbi:MAG: tetratricopeptide repeat protein [Gemmatimonadales bacterium]
MERERWDRIQTIFHAAAELPPADREAFLDDACRGDETLRAEVQGLLQADATGSLLDRGMADLAHAVLDTSIPSIPAGLLEQRFGPYRISEVLGEGGMGVVYLARRDDLGSVAAIKILRDASLSPARRERFAFEQRTLAQLNHPSIARLYDADTLPDGTPWFVMEHVEGESLTRYCETHASPLAARLRLFHDVCEAVQHAHLHLVIHRDLKPSNIRVTPDGTVKLLDFGIAKQLDSLEGPVDQTRTGLGFMTPAYAAPEQIRGERVGIHTDVYSLGVILYELLVGRLPFDLTGRTPAEVETIVTTREPEKPSAAARRMAYLPGGGSRGVSASATSWADLDVLCLTAMHKDPARRYRTVEALIRDIDHFNAGEPLEAQPDSWRYRMGKYVRRNWRPLAAAVAVFAVVVGLVGFYTARLAHARNAAITEAARTQRIQSFMQNLFQGGDEAAGPAESLRVVTLVDRGIQEAGSLEQEPAVQAELYETLGTLSAQLGNLDQADSLLQKSLDRRRETFGPEHADVARTLVAIGLLRGDQARFDEAEQLVRDGLAMNRRTLPRDHPAIARATTALGQILENRGEYDQAIPILEEAVRLQSVASPGSADLSEALTDLANTHFYAGNLEISDSLNRQVLALDRELYGAHHPNVASDLINLGAIRSERGHQAEAEQLYREALEITRAWYGDNHPATASNLTMLARVIVSQERDSEAIGLLHQALDIDERVYGAVHPRIASTLNELGRIAERQGRLEEAAADFGRMGEIYRAVYGDRHYLIGVAQANLAGVLMKQGHPARAVGLFREVIRRFDQALPADHLLAGIARIRLGHALVAERRYREAVSELEPGYAIALKKGGPSLGWLAVAREDLAAAYAAMGDEARAAAWRTVSNDE